MAFQLLTGNGTSLNTLQHDVILWNCFTHYWLFVRESNGVTGGFPLQRVGNAELWFVLSLALISCWTNSRVTHDLRCFDHMMSLLWIWAACCYINSLWPSHTISCQHRFLSTLGQVMACCLKTPSHYLSQSWFIICKVLWQSHEICLARETSAINYSNQLENYSSAISFKSPRGQWLKHVVGRNFSNYFWIYLRYSRRKISSCSCYFLTHCQFGIMIDLGKWIN